MAVKPATPLRSVSGFPSTARPVRKAPSATLRALFGRASGRAVAGKPAFFFIGYARRSGRPVLHFGIRRTVLCSRWSRTDRRTPTFRTRRLSDRLLRDARSLDVRVSISHRSTSLHCTTALALPAACSLMCCSIDTHFTSNSRGSAERIPQENYTDGRERKKG